MSSSLYLYEPFYDLDRLLDETMGPSSASKQGKRKVVTENDGAIRGIKPCMDLHEDSKNNTVTATFELPGLDKDHVSIDVQNNRLSVSGDSKISSDREEGGYAVRERRFGKFSRTLQLPVGIKDDEIKAKMDNGVLEVTFPKASAELGPKKITVN